MLPADVVAYIARHFAPPEQEEARRLLAAALLHDGSLPSARLLRCAAVASGGSVERLRMEVATLRQDYRDVIVEGEYAPVAGQLVRVRNLEEPIPDEQ